MKTRDLKRIGYPSGSITSLASVAIGRARKAKMNRETIAETMGRLLAHPREFLEREPFQEVARALVELDEAQGLYRDPSRKAPYQKWGRDLDKKSLAQIENACRLPVSVRGALMPDAHVGYGLPIGGVLATENAVIPYAVGVDIACRVKMTVLDLPLESLRDRQEALVRSIEEETRFGIGANFKRPREHPVMDRDWNVTRVTGHLRDRAWSQLGTSGSGNHFVEFGRLDVTDPEAGLEPGSYLALMSHSGSRGAGARVADHYSRIAMDLHPELPPELRYLAWLDLDRSEGQEYWRAMELMGEYAAANHACIHRHIRKNLGARVLLDLENHHNFAWKEIHDGRELIVHRKGATPAGEGVLGIIPGSMASATYVVRGLGNPESLESAAHGAGRVMSRTQARKTFRWKEVQPLLEHRGVRLLSAGLDEVPGVYKDIEAVMEAQADLVQPLGRFFPSLVKMAPAGEKPED